MSKSIQHIVRRAQQSMQDPDHDTDAGWDKFRQKCVVKMRKRPAIYRYAGYVAAIIVLLSVGMLTWYSFSREPMAKERLHFSGGSSHAELILANGERIQLDRTQREVAVEGLGVHISRGEKDGVLEYQTDALEVQDTVLYNQLKVPKGGEYVLKLPDGSVIHVNSESVLKFPVRFASNRREVYLEGEAFFEVARNEKAPFLVHAGDKSVTVLGTRFNVSAYPRDLFWQTTLIQGKVSVQSDSTVTILQPSQQCSIDLQTGRMEVNTVETELYTSWMNGKFYFKGYRFEDIVRKLERWYDFEMIYQQEDIKDMCFRGVINKDRPLEETLKFLEETTNIVFEIDGRIITVKRIDR